MLSLLFFIKMSSGCELWGCCMKINYIKMIFLWSTILIFHSYIVSSGQVVTYQNLSQSQNSSSAALHQTNSVKAQKPSVINSNNSRSSVYRPLTQRQEEAILWRDALGEMNPLPNLGIIDRFAGTVGMQHPSRSAYDAMLAQRAAASFPAQANKQSLKGWFSSLWESCKEFVKKDRGMLSTAARWSESLKMAVGLASKVAQEKGVKTSDLDDAIGEVSQEFSPNSARGVHLVGLNDSTMQISGVRGSVASHRPNSEKLRLAPDDSDSSMAVDISTTSLSDSQKLKQPVRALTGEQVTPRRPFFGKTPDELKAEGFSIYGSKQIDPVYKDLSFGLSSDSDIAPFLPIKKSSFNDIMGRGFGSSKKTESKFDASDDFDLALNSDNAALGVPSRSVSPLSKDQTVSVYSEIDRSINSLAQRLKGAKGLSEEQFIESLSVGDFLPDFEENQEFINKLSSPFEAKKVEILKRYKQTFDDRKKTFGLEKRADDLDRDDLVQEVGVALMDEVHALNTSLLPKQQSVQLVQPALLSQLEKSTALLKTFLDIEVEHGGDASDNLLGNLIADARTLKEAHPDQYKIYEGFLKSRLTNNGKVYSDVVSAIIRGVELSDVQMRAILQQPDVSPASIGRNLRVSVNSGWIFDPQYSGFQRPPEPLKVFDRSISPDSVVIDGV